MQSTADIPAAPALQVAHPASRTRSLRAMVLFLGAGIVAVTIPFMEDVFLYATVVLLGACFLVPLALDRERGRIDWFAPIHVFGGVYFMYFGLGAVWTVHSPNTAYDLHVVPFVPQAAFYCLLGYLALLAGYYVPWRRPERRRTAEHWPRGSKFVVLIGLVGLIGFIALAVWTRASWTGATYSALLSSLGQLSPLFIQAWAIGWMLFFARQATAGLKLALFGLFVPGTLFVLYLTVSNKTMAFVLLGVPVIAFTYARDRLPWKVLLVMFLLLVFVVFPFYNTYRWQDKDLSQTERLSATYHTVQSWDSETYRSFSSEGFMRRMSIINSVALVVRDVGRWVPHAMGETLIEPLIFAVPRVLWPGKPQQMLGREFGRYFRVTDYSTRKTFIDSSLPGELYWNFDVPGIVGGMALLGVLMRWLYRRYSASPGLDPIRRSIGIVVLVHIGQLSGFVVLGLVGLARVLLLIEFLVWLGRRAGMIESRR